MISRCVRKAQRPVASELSPDLKVPCEPGGEEGKTSSSSTGPGQDGEVREETSLVSLSFPPKGVVPHSTEKESWEGGIILHAGKGRRRRRSLSKATLPGEAPQVWSQPCWLQGLTFQAQLRPFVKVPRVQAVRTSVLTGHTPASLLLSEPTLQGLRGPKSAQRPEPLLDTLLVTLVLHLKPRQTDSGRPPSPADQHHSPEASHRPAHSRPGLALRPPCLLSAPDATWAGCTPSPSQSSSPGFLRAQLPHHRPLLLPAHPGTLFPP